jgi:hypothetical protein
MYPRSITKAKLKSKDKGGEIKLPFNPTQVSLTIGCSVSESKNSGPIKGNRIPIQGEGPKPCTLKFDFILDATEPAITDGLNMMNMMNPVIMSSKSLSIGSNRTANGSDSVGKILSKLTSWTDLTKDSLASNLSPRPHVIYFYWTDQLSFTGMINNLSYDFLLFDSDGEVLRAKVSIELKGYPGEHEPDDIVTLKGTSEASSEQSFG